MFIDYLQALTEVQSSFIRAWIYVFQIFYYSSRTCAPSTVKLWSMIHIHIHTHILWPNYNTPAGKDILQGLYTGLLRRIVS